MEPIEQGFTLCALTSLDYPSSPNESGSFENTTNVEGTLQFKRSR